MYIHDTRKILITTSFQFGQFLIDDYCYSWIKSFLHPFFLHVTCALLCSINLECQKYCFRLILFHRLAVNFDYKIYFYCMQNTQIKKLRKFIHYVNQIIYLFVNNQIIYL